MLLNMYYSSIFTGDAALPVREPTGLPRPRKGGGRSPKDDEVRGSSLIRHRHRSINEWRGGRGGKERSR